MAQELSFIPFERTHLGSVLDFKYLRQKALDYAQALAGDHWTDYNEHDPGITLLEQFCFALTELVFKTQTPIQNLLADPKLGRMNKTLLALLEPQDILSCYPVTVDDYRKVIFDEVKGVLNVWLEPLQTAAYSQKGLYVVKLQAAPYLKNDEAGCARILEESKNVYSKYRNLCEDVSDIHVLDELPIAFSCQIQTNEKRTVEDILADILFILDNHLTPELRFYSFEEISKRYNDNVLEIFEGPFLKHGFMDNADMKPKIKEFAASDLSKIMMTVEDVINITNFKVLVDGQVTKQELITLNDNQVPRLDIGLIEELFKKQIIVFLKNGIVYQPDFKKALIKYLDKKNLNRSLYITENALNGLATAKVNRKIDFNYYSIQNHFPEIYGLGEFGVSSSASAERIAQVKQLKAYLMFFEQIMANYLAQLEALPNLFSVNHSTKTYFSQNISTKVPSVKSFNLVKKDYGILSFDQIASSYNYAEALESLNQKLEDNTNRRSRFLDYMLAIYGENFSQYDLAKFNCYHSEAAYEEHLLKAKSNFLKRLADFSRARGQALDYQHFKHTAGIEARLILALDLADSASDALQQSMFHGFTEAGLELVQAGTNELWNDNAIIENTTLTAEYIEKNFILADPETEMMSADAAYEEFLLRKTIPFLSNCIEDSFLRLSLNSMNFRIGNDGSGTGLHYLVYKDTNSQEWCDAGMFPSLNDAFMALSALKKLSAKLNYLSESMHLVEHNLLRPSPDEEVFMFAFHFKEIGLEFVYDTPLSAKSREDSIKAIKEEVLQELNYFIRRESDNAFWLCFQTSNTLYSLSHIKPYESREKAQVDLDAIRNVLHSHVQPRFERTIRLKHHSESLDVPEVFYAFRLSFVFPSWPVRFQSNEFRVFVEGAVKRHTPAHIQPFCYFLNWKEAKEFETVFFDWLKNIAERTSEAYKEHSFNMTRLLHALYCNGLAK